MTPYQLIIELKKYIEEKTRDLLLPVRVTSKNPDEEKNRPPHVYMMDLPKKKDEIQQIPYILIKYLTGIDDQPEGKHPESEANVRIIVAVYGDDAEEGEMALLNVISRLRIALMEDQEVGEQFRWIPPMEHIIYQDNTRPYYIGEIMTRWTMPPIERKVSYYDIQRTDD